MRSFDANILFYAADKTAGVRHPAAQQLLRNAAGPSSALTEQSLFEFFHSSTRKGKIPIAEATVIIQDLLANFILLFPHRTVVEDAVVLFSRHKLSIWDARLLAVCGAHGCDYLFSEDMQDGAQYGGVTVVDPFKMANAAIVKRALSV